MDYIAADPVLLAKTERMRCIGVWRSTFSNKMAIAEAIIGFPHPRIQVVGGPVIPGSAGG
jgi:hypothetical protein